MVKPFCCLWTPSHTEHHVKGGGGSCHLGHKGHNYYFPSWEHNACGQQEQLLLALLNTAPCLYFPSFPLHSLKSNGQSASVLLASSLTILASHIQNIHTRKYTVKCMHTWTQQVQTHLRGVPKSFRSGRPDTETQETIGCQWGPWARHISPSWACWLLNCCCVGCFTRHRNKSPSGSPSSFVDKKKWAGIIQSQDGRVADRQREERNGTDLFKRRVLVTTIRPWVLFWKFFRQRHGKTYEKELF